MRTQGTYYFRGKEEGLKERLNAEYFVPPLFFEKVGDNKQILLSDQNYIVMLNGYCLCNVFTE